MSQQSIRKLSEDVINKIAAGEVVERPASIVKELMENSIDAGSTKITVKIKNAGLSLIQIEDNGIGMGKNDLKLAFQQHTTSKIKSIEDLAKIQTLGFRGEALASISSVAKVEVNSNTGKESTRLIIQNEKYQFSNTACNRGTSIKITDLFYNIPVRKKFLRSENTEFKHIQNTFLKHAIANPTIHFKFISNNREIFNLPSTNQLQVRINDIWPNKFKDKLIDIKFKTHDFEITGLLTHPDIANRASRDMQFLSINKRPIKSDLISKAIKDAYHSAIYKDFYPIFFIDISLNPKFVDINIHPRKEEVKFANTGLVYSLVKQACQNTLEKFLQQSVKQSFLKTTDFKPQSKNYAIKNPTTTIKEPENQYIRKNLVNKSLEFSKHLLSPVTLDETLKKENNTLLEEFDDFKFFQIFKTFIILEKHDKLLFIDQHAAHERINYEKIMKQVKNKQQIETQQLLVPQTLDLDPAQLNNILGLKEELKKIGLAIEKFGPKTIKLTTMPTLFKNFNFENFINELSDNLINKIDPEQLLHLNIATMACHGSIRAGQKLHKNEAVQLIKDLFKCDKPHSCPHGRPIIWELTKNEIEKQFKRTGFC